MQVAPTGQHPVLKQPMRSFTQEALLTHWQLPFRHTDVFPQTFPHVPQLLRSEVTLTQVFPQHTLPDGQGGLQTLKQAPLTHSWPAKQALPQPPQLVGSVWVFTHVPEQTVVPDGH